MRTGPVRLVGEAGRVAFAEEGVCGAGQCGAGGVQGGASGQGTGEDGFGDAGYRDVEVEGGLHGSAGRGRRRRVRLRCKRVGGAVPGGSGTDPVIDS